MDLREKIISLSEYKLGFTTTDENAIIFITYKDSWAVIEPTDDKIGFYKDDKTPNKYYYVTKLSDNPDTIQGVFDTIDETIIYNKELEQKVELLKVKSEELYNIFMEKSLDELMTLQFVMTKPKPKTAPAKSKKKASAPNKPKKTANQQPAKITDDNANEEDVEELDSKIMKSIAQVTEKNKEGKQ